MPHLKKIVVIYYSKMISKSFDCHQLYTYCPRWQLARTPKMALQHVLGIGQLYPQDKCDILWKRMQVGIQNEFAAI